MSPRSDEEDRRNEQMEFFDRNRRRGCIMAIVAMAITLFVLLFSIGLVFIAYTR